MAARGHIPPAYEGRPIQAPGMMRHGPFPGIASPVLQPLERLPPLELLENKIVVQAAEMDRLARENQRLAATHVNLRQELIVTQQEMQRIQAHIGNVHKEADLQTRELSEQIAKMEADVCAGESFKKELQQANMEAQRLMNARRELTSEIQLMTDELQKVNVDIKKLPAMHAMLDGLRQEHQNLRATFQYEKGSNLEQVEQMKKMETNLISMAREVEKLRADVLNAERSTHAPSPYGANYTSSGPVYPPAGQGIAYPDPSYGQNVGSVGFGFVQGHAGAYTDGGIVQGAPGGYTDGYGRPQAQMTGGLPAEGMVLYGGVNVPGYSDMHGRPLAQMPGEGMNPYAVAGGVGVGVGVGPYNAAMLAQATAPR